MSKPHKKLGKMSKVARVHALVQGFIILQNHSTVLVDRVPTSALANKPRDHAGAQRM
jgi:hypothetical protein